MMRPIPNLEDSELMGKLGRLHAVRNAWLDAVHALRDCTTKLNSEHGRDIETVELAIKALERMKLLLSLDEQL